MDHTLTDEQWNAGMAAASVALRAMLIRRDVERLTSITVREMAEATVQAYRVALMNMDPDKGKPRFIAPV